MGGESFQPIEWHYDAEALTFIGFSQSASRSLHVIDFAPSYCPATLASELSPRSNKECALRHLPAPPAPPPFRRRA